MLARLILALLLAAFAIPAMAAAPSCHAAPMTSMTDMAAPMTHGAGTVHHPKDHATVSHVCIGCIPPASLAARGVNGLRVTAVLPRHIVAIAFAPDGGSAPVLPPPRRAA